MLDTAEVLETEANPIAEIAKLQEGPAVEGKAAAQGVQVAEDAAKAESIPAAEPSPVHKIPVEAAAEGTAIEGPYSGALCKDPNPRPDIGAEKLAAKLNGQSRVYFSNDPIKKEFDVISNEFIAEAKPAMQSIKPEFRQQAKRAFEAARQTGRKVYFHFNGEPCRDIIRKLQEYQRRYGIEMIIDTEVLY